MGRGKEYCRRGDARPVINKKKEEGSYFRARITSGWPIVEKVYAQYAFLRPKFGLDCFSMPALPPFAQVRHLESGHSVLML
jgi:hypothetical protein